MHSSKFAPKAGERHRAMVRSALSIYEESMGHHNVESRSRLIDWSLGVDMAVPRAGKLACTSLV